LCIYDAVTYVKAGKLHAAIQMDSQIKVRTGCVYTGTARLAKQLHSGYC